jgi:DNA-directed RNA polymerase specialized sigma subunit
MTTWTVHAKRWEHGWELDIDDAGITQARTLAVAERQARDYLSLLLDRDVSGDEVVIIPEVGVRLAREVREARRAVAELAERQRAVATLSRSVARDLRSAGLAGSEIATVLSVSPQRASQLLKEG